MAKPRRAVLHLLTLTLAASAVLAGPAMGQALDLCSGGLCSLAAQPVVVFDRTGLLFAADVNFHLTVYENGRAVASRSVTPRSPRPDLPDPDPDGWSELTHVPPDAVAELRWALLDAGAARVAGDQIAPGLFTNLSQVSTLTLLRPARREGRLRGNAFSFVSGDPRFREIEALVSAFVNEWFEGL